MFNVIFDNLGNTIWIFFFLPVLFITAGILTVGCRGLQFRHFSLAMKKTVGQIFSKRDKSGRGLSPFQAASTALGSTVGTGNIVGTAQAIAMGGPGALFWLWVAALISMIVKYAEICLAIKYRKSAQGFGPMDYIEHGLGSKKLASCYCFLALLSSLAMGNITQVSSITDSFLAAANAYLQGPTISGTGARLAIGLMLGAITVLLLSGGAKRIGKCSELLVPFMVLLFIGVSLAVIAGNINKLPGVLSTVIREAFSPGSVCGGLAGVSTAKCIQWGFRRSAFSNEAGLGTSAIAHASANADNAAEQGLWGIFEVFADTIVICSCTSLCILCSGIDIPWGKLTGSELYLRSLETLFGLSLSSLLLAVFIGLFAYTSLIGWAFYGGRCMSYLFGESAIKAYHVIFILLLLIGSVLPLQSVWKIADTVNALMSVPNLCAVLLLTPAVIKLSRDSFS